MKPKALPVRLEGIPSELKEINAWVMWSYRQRHGKWTKVPRMIDGKNASSTNPNTWTSYGDVVDTLIMGEGFGGIGLVLGGNLHGVDLDDCRDPESGVLNALAQEVLERVQGYAEISPSGTGIKIFTRTNLDQARTKKEVGIELYKDGRYFTVTGHCIDTHSRVPDDVQDLGWLVDRVWGEVVQVNDAGGVADLAHYKPTLEGWDLERVVMEVLPHLDPDCGYVDWLKIGAALHHQGEGDHEWLAAWDSWSEGSSKYAEGVCEEKWDSFSQQRTTGKGAVTLASLLKDTKDKRTAVVRDERDQAMGSVIDQIEAALDPRDLQEKVAATVANNGDFSDVDRARVASAIQARAKTLGVSLEIGTVRGWLRSRIETDKGIAPSWTRDWVYILDSDKFFNVDTKDEITRAGFRAKFNREMHRGSSGNREWADQWCLENWNMQVVSHKAYMPQLDSVFQMTDLWWVNSYRPKSVPTVPEHLTNADEEAIQVVRNHFHLYLTDQRERELLISFIAHNVRSPGVKIRWAPYVHGVPGDGKSFFGNLLMAAMGVPNVRVLNGSTLKSDFTDWATGCGVVLIEEMKQVDKNVMNKLKTYISNDIIEIHPKGKASYSTQNSSNYMMFSNYLNGASIDDSDRRYMFLSSNISKEEARKMSEQEYFESLFSALREHPGAIRKWLMEYPLHKEFGANTHAPYTDVRRTVVEMSKDPIQVDAEELLSRGTVGVTANALSSSHFTTALSYHHGITLRTTNVNQLFPQLGYEFLGKKKWNGSKCTIWARKSLGLSIEQAIEELNKSKGIRLLESDEDSDSL